MIIQIVVLCAVILVVIFILMLSSIDRFISKVLFQPTRYNQDLPDETYREVYFKNSKKQKLHGVFFPFQVIRPNESPVGTILYLHGIGGNISQMLELGKLRSAINYNIFIFDYAGYGKNEGKPTTSSILDDGLAALTFLNQQEEIPTNRIIIYGVSLGGSIAIDLASKHKCKALIVESTFTSLVDMGYRILNSFIRFLCQFFMREKLESIKKIKNVYCPVFISHGCADEAIPFEQGQRLFSAANEPKMFFIPPKGMDYHCAPYSNEHKETLKRFIESL